MPRLGFQNLTTDLKVEKESSLLRSNVSRNNGRRAQSLCDINVNLIRFF